jgi:hypothetical protein
MAFLSLHKNSANGFPKPVSGYGVCFTSRPFGRIHRIYRPSKDGYRDSCLRITAVPIKVNYLIARCFPGNDVFGKSRRSDKKNKRHPLEKVPSAF